ncbi:MAG TPA: anti-sigma factor [Actinomycetota bacterium]|nr:anti-sigma factor [Actinomycetota bacterium]
MTASADLTCREMVELMNDYLEGALAEGERARFEAHLSSCDPCTTYLAQVRETIRLAGRVTEESVPADVRDQLLQAFRDWKGA